MSTIYVTNLFDMPDQVRRLRPARLVSIIQPEFQPERPPELAAESHLRVGVHDISAPEPGGVLIQRSDVEALIDFLDAWPPETGSLMVHCYAGVSRSTGTALIAHFIKTGDALRSARALRAAAPHAMPNRRLVELADAVLGCSGALIQARDSLGSVAIPHEIPLVALVLPSEG